MFPTIKCSFGGLARFKFKDFKFAILLDIEPIDNKRYRYAYHRSSWLVAGKADPPTPKRYFIHQDGPFLADHLSSISFDKVKLTNNELDTTGQVLTLVVATFYPNEMSVWFSDHIKLHAQVCAENSSGLVVFRPRIC